MSNQDQGDRFDENGVVQENGSMPALVDSLPSERPVGAQRLAVARRTDDKIFAAISALGAAAGGEWHYRFPIKKKDGGQDWIEGPTIKLANDVARIYGNCDVDVRVVEDTTSWVFYARFIDLETGFSMTRPFQQRKSQTSMGRNADRQRDIAFQIGASKSIRNVIVNSLQTYADYAFERARNSMVERIGKDLPGSRKRLAERIAERNYDPKRIERTAGRPLAEFLAPDIARTVAVFKSIDDGMASYDECFPPPQVANPLADDNPVAEKTQVAPGEAQIDVSASNEGEKIDMPRQARAEAEERPSDDPLPDSGQQPKTNAGAPQASNQPLRGEAYVTEASRIIDATNVASQLRNWWAGQRKPREAAELTTTQLTALMDHYQGRYDVLSAALRGE
jgi:hypothetical protein